MATAPVTEVFGVYLTPYSGISPSDLYAKSSDDLARDLTVVYGNAPENWTKVGSAEVTFRLDAHQDVVAAKVNALRAEQKRTLADAQAEATRIEGQIQSLLAITNEVAA